MTKLAEPELPALFAHDTRKDWGVGVLAGVRDGKRTYLFESGVERVMGGGAYDVMRKIAPLDAEQQVTLARLTALVARRQGLPDPSSAAGSMLLEQLTTFRRAFPGRFADGAWQAEKYAARARDTLVAEAHELLSLKALDAQLKAQQFDALWAAVSKVLLGSGWLSADQLKPTAGTGLGPVAGSVRELLYGSATLEQRVDRFVTAYETVFRRPARWETVSALLALVFPADQVLVDLASFRRQLKALGSKGSLPQRPSGAAYARSLNVARIVASKLAENGEAPQDLLDVHDFIRFTLKPAPAVRRAKTAKAAKKPSRAEREDADESSDAASDDGD